MFGLSQLSEALNQSRQHGVNNSCRIEWESCPQHTFWTGPIYTISWHESLRVFDQNSRPAHPTNLIEPPKRVLSRVLGFTDGNLLSNPHHILPNLPSNAKGGSIQRQKSPSIEPSIFSALRVLKKSCTRPFDLNEAPDTQDSSDTIEHCRLEVEFGESAEKFLSEYVDARMCYVCGRFETGRFYRTPQNVQSNPKISIEPGGVRKTLGVLQNYLWGLPYNYFWKITNLTRNFRKKSFFPRGLRVQFPSKILRKIILGELFS